MRERHVTTRTVIGISVLTIASLFIIGILVASGQPASARRALALQEPTTSPAAEPPAGDQQEILFQAALEALPQPPAYVQLARTTLQPGASIPLHVRPGPEFGVVESGNLTVRVGGQAVLAPAGDGGNPEPARVMPIDEDVVLQPGDQVVYPPDVAFTLSNASQEPTTFLVLYVVPRGNQSPPSSSWVGGTPPAGALDGVSATIVGEAYALAWPESPLLVVLDRLALDPGETIPASSGPVMFGVESGRLSFALVEGQYQISGGDSGLQANASPGARQSLTAGDAVFFPAGINQVPRPEDQTAMVLLRLSVLSANQVAAASTPAAGATQPAAAETPAAPTATFASGTIVIVNENGVRLRSSPSTTSNVVAELDQGRKLTVTGPPEEGDGIVWYPVQANDDEAVTGYIAEEFVATADG